MKKLLPFFGVVLIGLLCASASYAQQCDGTCTGISQNQSGQTIDHTHEEFTDHREWMVKTEFEQNILPAMMLMAEQMTAAAMNQVMVIGTFLDAKHQLETQRLFQQLMAEAHKDYQPSEGMCTFGTVTRSLAASDRNMDLSAAVLSRRVMQRELLNGDAISGNGQTSDYDSRLAQFRQVYCNPHDNARGLTELCPKDSVDPKRMNNDINYTALLEAPMTLRLDFTEEGDPDHAKNPHTGQISADEEDLLALSANLYAHEVAPNIPPALLASGTDGEPGPAAQQYMDIRAIAAKRSVARNSFAAIAAMKTQGVEEVAPYMHAIIEEMGITDPEEIDKYIGERPSYYAQMEVLTKKLYQNPTFYTELYDKPMNVKRKMVAMQAIELMQRRDMYRSLLRSEATLAVMLETALVDPESKVINEIKTEAEDGGFADLPAAAP